MVRTSCGYMASKDKDNLELVHRLSKHSTKNFCDRDLRIAHFASPQISHVVGVPEEDPEYPPVLSIPFASSHVFLVEVPLDVPGY